ncbi:MAG: hypothetical protein LBV15_03055 [Planctomycetota bacterium]|jgi:hypothetical protein|nr:hypothetical protein [Planctomycetota bacterium]
MSLGAALVGAALGLFASKKAKAPDYSSLFASQAQAPAAPPAPAPPETPEGGKSAAVLAAEEAEKRRRLADKAANQTNFTGGLGLTGGASVERKSLLG